MRIFAKQQCKRFGKTASVKTIKRIVKSAGLRWKRMRRSLKTQRDEVLFSFFQSELNILMEQANNEHIDLYFFDESGFNLNPNVPYSWSLKGQQSCLPAQRSSGYTVLGLLNVQKQHFQGNIYEGAANSDCVIQVLDELAQQSNRKTVVILDNATIHTANKVKQRAKQWKEQQLFLQFIPAYCPELNLIEILWKMMKHYWLKVEQCQSLPKLQNEILRILSNYGQDYSITFV